MIAVNDDLMSDQSFLEWIKDKNYLLWQTGTKERFSFENRSHGVSRHGSPQKSPERIKYRDTARLLRVRAGAG